MARKKAAKAAPSQHWRDRIVDFRRLPARALQAHDGNWRRHSSIQRDAMTGVLNEIGIAGALLVYESQAHGGLTIIDGHLRTALDPEQDWPCLVLDVDDAEAAYILATHDPLSAMAEANAEVLTRLLADVQSGEAAVQAMLSALAEQHEIRPIAPPVVPETLTEAGKGSASTCTCPCCGYEWSNGTQ